MDNNKNKYRKLGSLCLIGLSIFFVGQIITQLGTTAPYSISQQAISDLGITQCGNYIEAQTKVAFDICSPLYPVMDATFILYGILIMFATVWIIRSMWPGRKLRKAGLVLIFFGGIESIIAGFSPLNLAPFLHSLSGGLAIAALNIGLVILGFAAIKINRGLGWFTLVCGLIGIIGLLLSGMSPYVFLGYGGWERVAGFAFPVWGICMGIYWLREWHTNGQV